MKKYKKPISISYSALEKSDGPSIIPVISAAPLAASFAARAAGKLILSKVAKAMFDDFNFSSYSEPNYPSLNPVIVEDKK